MKRARRHPSAARVNHDQDLVPISCPDCSGVLRLENEGPQDYPMFVCQIDHRYSTRSLIHAKETQLERTLWSAHVLLKQTVIAYEQVLTKAGLMSAADRKSMRRRIHEVRKQCLAIRAMIEATHAVE